MNEVIHAILTRRSVKSYQEKQIPQEVLAQILEAGSYAPCGRGAQSPRIIVLQNPEDIRALERLNCIAKGVPEDTHLFYGAPTVCLVLADAGCHTAVEDGALVIGNMMLAAQSLGIASCWIHRAKQEVASEEGRALLRKWGVTGEYVGVGHCILGYQDQAPKAAQPRKEDYIYYVK